MENLILNIFDIDRLNSARNCLATGQRLSKKDKKHLISFLSQLPDIKTLLVEKFTLVEMFEVSRYDLKNSEIHQWVELLGKLPGWDYCPFSTIVDNNSVELLRKNVVALAYFAPSMSYNMDEAKSAYEIHLMDSGKALFQLPTLNDAEKYPELYNFNGSWKEAYLLLIETLKNGWPMEEFPEELKPLLKK